MNKDYLIFDALSTQKLRHIGNYLGIDSLRDEACIDFFLFKPIFTSDVGTVMKFRLTVAIASNYIS